MRAVSDNHDAHAPQACARPAITDFCKGCAFIRSMRILINLRCFFPELHDARRADGGIKHGPIRRDQRCRLHFSLDPDRNAVRTSSFSCVRESSCVGFRRLSGLQSGGSGSDRCSAIRVSTPLPMEAAKKAAGEAAARMAEDGHLPGLGIGSTTAYAIATLGRRVRPMLIASPPLNCLN